MGYRCAVARRRRFLRTTGIMSVLVTLDYPPGSEVCEEIEKLTTVVVRDIAWLISKGHEKWAQVNFEFPVDEPNRSSCSSFYR